LSDGQPCQFHEGLRGKVVLVHERGVEQSVHLSSAKGEIFHIFLISFKDSIFFKCKELHRQSLLSQFYKKGALKN
jgi:hypothetical protein